MSGVLISSAEHTQYTDSPGSTDSILEFQKALLNNPGLTLKTNLDPASTSCFENTDELWRFKTAERKQALDPDSNALVNEFGDKAEYARYGNRTTNRVESLIATLCNREAAAIFQTRQGALTNLLSAVLLRQAGPHHILLGPDVSSEIFEYCITHLCCSEAGVSVEQLNQKELQRLNEYLKPETKLLLLENTKVTTETSETIRDAIRICSQNRVLSVLEGTAALPKGPSVRDSGADVLIPACEELSGTAGFNCGIVAGNLKIIELLKAERGLMGTIPAPEDALNLGKGLETYPLRISSIPKSGLAAGKNQTNAAVVAECEQQLATLEKADDAVLLSSGMTATTTLFSAILLRKPGPHHVIVSAQGYRKNREFYSNHLKNAGIEITAIEPQEFINLDNYLKPNTRLVFVETPTNPFFRITDINKVAAVCKKNGIISIADHTFATAINQRPLEAGIDLLCTSTTKYYGGHNDSIGGFVAGRKDLIDLVRKEQKLLGSYASAQTAEKVIFGLSSLELRMEYHNCSGMLVAEALADDPRIRTLWYPGHPSHPDYELAKANMTGFGGVLSFVLDTDYAGTKRFIDALELVKIAPSFGGTEPLVSQVAEFSHFSQTPEERAKLGIENSLIRLCTGLMPPDALIRDIKQALSRINLLQ